MGIEGFGRPEPKTEPTDGTEKVLNKKEKEAEAAKNVKEATEKMMGKENVIKRVLENPHFDTERNLKSIS